jgi:hypothetical protein
MPTSCPVKQNPIHLEWVKERLLLRDDVIYARTTVKQEYKGNLFRPSKRYQKKPKRKPRKIQRGKKPVHGTMGSYPINDTTVTQSWDDAQHQLSSGIKQWKSHSHLFPKEKRLDKKIRRWGQPYKALAMSTPSLNTFKVSKSIASDKYFGTTARSTFSMVPSQNYYLKSNILKNNVKNAFSPIINSPIDSRNVLKENHLVVPTVDGIPQNITWKKITHDCKTAFQSLVPRPCAKAFSTVAKNINKSIKIEKDIRKKHRIFHQTKKLAKVRKNFARRYSQTEAIFQRTKQGEMPEGCFKDSWTRPFNVEGSYESPFLGTSHHTRNVTLLSPLKIKQKIKQCTTVTT